MRETLIKIGLGPLLLGILFSLMNIANGTGQGYPSSSLLYVLVIEHLATALRSNPDIRGIMVGPRQYKLALYAHDLLLYVTSPFVSLLLITKEFERFGQLSNLKVNYSKSKALNLIYPENLVKHLSTTFSFKWQKTFIKYLGIHIAKLAFYLQITFLPLLQRSLKDLDTYWTRLLSWFDRIDAIKMDVLPRFYSYSRHCPLMFQHHIFIGLQKQCANSYGALPAPVLKCIPCVNQNLMEGQACQTLRISSNGSHDEVSELTLFPSQAMGKT